MALAVAFANVCNEQEKAHYRVGLVVNRFRRGQESNLPGRLCKPLHNLFATSPKRILRPCPMHSMRWLKTRALQAAAGRRRRAMAYWLARLQDHHEYR